MCILWQNKTFRSHHDIIANSYIIGDMTVFAHIAIISQFNVLASSEKSVAMNVYMLPAFFYDVSDAKVPQFTR